MMKKKQERGVCILMKSLRGLSGMRGISMGDDSGRSGLWYCIVAVKLLHKSLIRFLAPLLLLLSLLSSCDVCSNRA